MENFVTFDGTDANGVRAEVYVQKGTGTVSAIKTNPRGTADVSLKVGNLKYPIHGWVNIDSAIYVEAEKAHKENKEVTFRIEFQRKPNIDRATPIAELRENMHSAKNNIITILAELNNITSTEAITNPAEDPPSKTKGRIKASDNEPTPTTKTVFTMNAIDILKKIEEISKNGLFTSDIIANLAASALAQGADITEVAEALNTGARTDFSKPSTEKRAAFSVEAPSWVAYNSDGRMNLGHSSIQAVASMELFLNQHLKTTSFTEEQRNDMTVFFTKKLLTIADKIQTAAYGAGFRADRSAASYVKIRAIIFNTIETLHPLPELPLSEEKVEEWVKQVGRTSYHRFKNILEIHAKTGNFDTISIPNSLTGQPETVVESTVETPQPATFEKTQQEESVDVQQPVEETTTVNLEPEVSTETVETSPPVEETAPVLPAVKYPQNLLDETLLTDSQLPPHLTPSEETINTFKDLVQEFDLSKEEISKIRKLLMETFGKKFVKAQLIPEDHLLDFIDFYVAGGAESFKQILKEL
jgi:hypothetical protein